MGGEAEDKLLDCARHDNQLIRMEAYLALTKMGSQRVGPVLLDRLARLLATPPLDDRWQLDFRVPTAEMDIMADWIARFGTPGQREAFADILGKLIVGMDFCPLSWVFTWYAVPYVGTWQEWVGWQAATTRDQRLIPALEGLRSRLSPDRVPLELGREPSHSPHRLQIRPFSRNSLDLGAAVLYTASQANLAAELMLT